MLRARARTAAEARRDRIARDARAEVNVTMFGGRAFLRLSAHAYTSARDFELLAPRLRALL